MDAGDTATGSLLSAGRKPEDKKGGAVAGPANLKNAWDCWVKRYNIFDDYEESFLEFCT